MTYIEFFDKTASENVCACLTYTPKRVIFIGFDSKTMDRHIEYYRRVFKDRGYSIEFLSKVVSRSNLDSAVQTLTNIVETYDDCVFDITGGEEIVNLALGIVYARFPEKNIQIQKFNFRNNAVYDCDKDGKTVYKDIPQLSVKENVRIYGGDVVYGEIFEDKTYDWDLNSDFIKDINLMWSVCKGNVRYWNTIIGIFGAAEIVGNVACAETLTTVADLSVLEAYLAQHKAKYKVSKGIVRYLLKHGLLTLFDDSDGENVIISYKNEQVKKCLTKAGQVLEMKIYITVKKLIDSDGELVYDDAVNGAVIDWDGELHDRTTDGEYDTENEIDILLMHNMIPIFVSCKNGIVTAEELYKLNTVAERFGAQYAKKVLVATSVSSMGEAGKYLRQRAKDMNIDLVENVQNLEEKELENILKNLWRNR